ncbi:MAG: hypothetical protein R2761_15665 [Acidimicrobiales bacterium]
MTRSAGRIRLVAAVAIAGLALAACGGSGESGADTTVPPATTEQAAPATTEAAAGTTLSTSPSPSVIGGSDDPATIEWRNKLLAVSTGFNQARSACFADPVACAPTFDSTVGDYLTGTALTEVRTNLDAAAAQGIRSRGIDPGTMYYQGFQLFKEDPADAALSLCVVDKAVRYVPASGAEPEKIVDDSQVTYFVVYRIQAGADGALRIGDIASTEFVTLEGEYGQCDQYAR